MNRVFPAILAALAALSLASCAGSRRDQVPPPPGRGVALLAALDVPDAPMSLSEGKRVAMEMTALSIVAEGPSAAPALLSDIETRRDAHRRMVVVRLLAMIMERVPAAAPEREALDEQAARSARRLLDSADASDRYMGLYVSALPKKSLLVPSAVEMLSDPSAADRSLAIFVLRQVGQIDLGYNPDAPAADRKPAVKRWKKWWGDNKSKAVYYSHAPLANPLGQALAAEASEVMRYAGPYPVDIVDKATDKPLEGAIVAYEYQFTTFDGRGESVRDQTATDSDGKMLMARREVSSGMRYTGAQVIVSRTGYERAAYRLLPHVLTPNSYTVRIALEPSRQ